VITKKNVVLAYVAYAVIFCAAFRYLVAPAGSLHSVDVDLAPGQTSLTLDLPSAYLYMLKVTVPAGKISEVIEKGGVFFNGELISLCDVNRIDGGTRLNAVVRPDALKPSGNILTLPSYDRSVHVSVSNYKKIYARYENMYFGDAFLLYGGGGRPAGFDPLFSLTIGFLLSFIWVFTAHALAAGFWCDHAKAYRANLLLAAFLSLLAIAQQVALRIFGYHVVTNVGTYAVVLLVLFSLLAVVEMFVLGRERARHIGAVIVRRAAYYDDRYAIGGMAVWAMIIAYIGLFSWLQYVRHRAFFPSMDLNSIVQLTHNAMQGRVWEMQDGAHQLVSYLCFHLQPVYLLFVPLYALFRSNLIFYFVQTAVIAFGALPAYWISAKALRNRGYGVLFAMVYLLYPSIHNCTMYGFHFEELSIGIGMFAFWALYERKRVMFVAMCLLLMSLKENIAAVAFMLGVFALIRREWITGIFVAAVSAAWFYLCLFVIIPHYSSPGQMTYSQSFFSSLGGSENEIVRNVFVNAKDIAAGIAANQAKMHFLWCLFAPLFFLPALAPDILMIAAPIFGQLLLSHYARFHDITIFYQSSLLPFMFIAAVFGFARLCVVIDWLSFRIARTTYRFPGLLIGAAVLASVVGFAVRNIMPANVPWYFVGGVYSISHRDDFIRTYLDRIPAESSAAVPLMHYEYLSGRRYVYNLSVKNIDTFKPDIVFINAYICWPMYGEYRYNQEIVDYLTQLPDYRLILNAEGYFIFERKDAMFPAGMIVRDFHHFGKTGDVIGGECSYAGYVDSVADGMYDLSLKVSPEVIVLTTDERGYDSFEYLPGFKDVDCIAQSFTAPDGQVSAVDIYARRVGTPALSLVIREDVNGKPSDKDIVSVRGKAAAGTLFKFDWRRFDVSSVRLEPNKKYWLLLKGEGDGSRNRYDIAAFSRKLKGEGYADRALYRYAGNPGEWREPYPRNPQVEDEQGHPVDGIMFRLISTVPENEHIELKIDGKPAFAKMITMKKGARDNTSTFLYQGISLSAGDHEIVASGPAPFQLEYIEVLKHGRK